jgi:hypothetical protein
MCPANQSCELVVNYSDGMHFTNTPHRATNIITPFDADSGVVRCIEALMKNSHGRNSSVSSYLKKTGSAIKSADGVMFVTLQMHVSEEL